MDYGVLLSNFERDTARDAGARRAAPRDSLAARECGRGWRRIAMETEYAAACAFAGCANI